MHEKSGSTGDSVGDTPGSCQPGLIGGKAVTVGRSVPSFCPRRKQKTPANQ